MWIWVLSLLFCKQIIRHWRVILFESFAGRVAIAAQIIQCQCLGALTSKLKLALAEYCIKFLGATKTASLLHVVVFVSALINVVRTISLLLAVHNALLLLFWEVIHKCRFSVNVFSTFWDLSSACNLLQSVLVLHTTVQMSDKILKINFALKPFSV